MDTADRGRGDLLVLAETTAGLGSAFVGGNGNGSGATEGGSGNGDFDGFVIKLDPATRMEASPFDSGGGGNGSASSPRHSVRIQPPSNMRFLECASSCRVKRGGDRDENDEVKQMSTAPSELRCLAENKGADDHGDGSGGTTEEDLSGTTNFLPSAEEKTS